MANYVRCNYSVLMTMLLVVFGFSKGSITVINVSSDQYDDIYYDYDFDSTMNDTLGGNSTKNSTFGGFYLKYYTAIDNVLPTINSICPEWNVGESLEPPVYDGSHCCSSCSTGPSCHAEHGYNFCCPHAEMAYKSNSGTSATCFSAYTGALLSYRFDYSFMTVTGCRQTSLNSRIQTTPVLEDMALVHADGILYRNRNTAECNGVSHYERWRLMVTGCNYQELWKRFAGHRLVQNVLQKCIVYSVPPPDFNTTPFLCSQSGLIVYSCNITGLWDKKDESLKFLCLTGKGRLVYDTDGVEYNNVFCLACNKPVSYIRTPQSCKTFGTREIPQRGKQYVVLAEDGYNITEIQRLSAGICDSGFVRDIYQKKCRPIICPSSAFVFKSDCLSMGKLPRGRYKDIKVVLRLSQSVSDFLMRTDHSIITAENHNENNHEILRYTGINDDCTVNRSRMLSYNSLPDYRRANFFIYELYLAQSIACLNSIETLSQNNKTWDNNDFPMKIGPHVIPVTVQRTVPLQDIYINIKATTISSYPAECKNCSVETISHINCPFIKLSPMDFCFTYNLVYPNGTSDCTDMLTSSMFQQNVIIGDEFMDGDWWRVFYICVDYYNTMFRTPVPVPSVQTINRGGILQPIHVTMILIGDFIYFTYFTYLWNNP